MPMMTILRGRALARQFAIAVVAASVFFAGNAKAQEARFLELLGEKAASAILGERALLPALPERPSYEVFNYNQRTYFRDIQRSRLFRVRGEARLDEAVNSCEDLLTQGRVKINVYDDAAKSPFITKSQLPETWSGLREVLLTDGAHAIERPAIQVENDAGSIERIVRLRNDALVFARVDGTPFSALESGLRASTLARRDIHIVSLIDDTHVDAVFGALENIRYTRVSPERIGDVTKIVAATKRSELLVLFSHIEDGALKVLDRPSPGLRVDAVRAAVKGANARVLTIGCGAALGSHLPGTLDVVYANDMANKLAGVVDATNLYDFLAGLKQRLVVDATLVEIPKTAPPEDKAAGAEWQLWRILHANVHIVPNLAITLPPIKGVVPLDGERASSAVTSTPATVGFDAAASWDAAAPAAGSDQSTPSNISRGEDQAMVVSNDSPTAPTKTGRTLFIVLIGVAGGAALYATRRKVL